ncbi:CD63 antigen-like isoform X2 [Echeneis naucrates]|uniref:Tetraspanin n=1 Tax=Echeneis naucrates TaxID=173247 RepID=A0A665XB25_ECHNA|nr:CD63 antigen-like isoform X2 [Echeneis naucrates]
MGICGIKCCFIFFNVLFLASGIALITIGALQYTTYIQIGAFAGSGLSKIAIVLIAVGVTIALVSLMGHVGAFVDNSSMVACFVCILIVIILLEILTGAAFYIFRSRTALLEVNSGINGKARSVIRDYSPGKRYIIDRVQEKFKCCGADSFTDWSGSVGWEKPDAVPDSCCVVKTDGCGQDISHAHKKFFGAMLGVCLCLDIKRKSYENID